MVATECGETGSLTGQPKATTQLQGHVLVVHHIHPGNTLPHPWDLEPILLPLENEAID
jgi:hypothetical protein